MKKLIFILPFLFGISCSEKPSNKISEEESKRVHEKLAQPAEFSIIEFNKIIHDFGNINEGDQVSTEFEIKNVGKVDLLILDAKGSCGCTVPIPPKEPIVPGKSSKIKVDFNSDGKPGIQEKSITLIANTETGVETIKIRANVIPNKNKFQKKIHLP